MKNASVRDGELVSTIFRYHLWLISFVDISLQWLLWLTSLNSRTLLSSLFSFNWSTV